ncbi:Na(+)/H(+) antiporter subunit F1 [Evansella cellulosilytica]|uniref:Multiple resistance and pH regulation protein F n=1 Tax=Evansella cellulosilytica (strain ATCC 21833 / DSM 2522 / FERM P-1141 / JCM 9156 / N-4) TaxID=649639 RepID=E6TVZ9_EVAC2|nr:Na(+)/H(+) antiporter subunit F1 [Evansella cellulosilytica]ADU29822.1 multiple resistance and pH regulation protein F [Evansella cellulosilytica DSM 2522]
MLQTSATIVLVLMSLSILICFTRVLKGPTLSDRVVALDTIGINLIGFIGIIMIIQETVAYAEVILVIAILAFIGTIALAKFIEGGVVLDRDRR